MEQFPPFPLIIGYFLQKKHNRTEVNSELRFQVYGEARFEAYFNHKNHLIKLEEVNP
jgi:hypothetical protein